MLREKYISALLNFTEKQISSKAFMADIDSNTELVNIYYQITTVASWLDAQFVKKYINHW